MVVRIRVYRSERTKNNTIIKLVRSFHAKLDAKKKPNKYSYIFLYFSRFIRLSVRYDTHTHTVFTQPKTPVFFSVPLSDGLYSEFILLITTRLSVIGI